MRAHSQLFSHGTDGGGGSFDAGGHMGDSAHAAHAASDALSREMAWDAPCAPQQPAAPHASHASHASQGSAPVQPDGPHSWARQTSDEELATVLPWMFDLDAAGHVPGAPPSNDGGWAIIAYGRSQLEAQMILAALRDAGIEALCDEPMLVPLGDALRQRHMRVPVRVRANAQRRAEAALRRHIEESRRIDWDAVDVGQRTDSLVGRAPGRLPALAIVGAVVAAALILIMIAASVMMIVR